MNMSAGSTGSTFPKWQLAVLLGAPVAIGLGIVYWRRQSSDTADLNDAKKKKFTRGVTNSLDEDDKSVSRQNSSIESLSKTLPPIELARSLKDEGNKVFKNGNYADAILLYDKAIKTCSTSNNVELATFYQNRAAAYEKLKKWTAVRDDCTRALELNPKYVKAYHRRAKALEECHDLSGSLEDITATCILEAFQNKSSLMFADRMLKKLGAESAKAAIAVRSGVLPSRQFIKAYFASYLHDPIKRIVVAGTDQRGFVHAKMALDAGKFDDVIPACTEEIEKSADSAKTYYRTEAFLLRGTMLYLSGRYPESLADLNAVIDNADAGLKFRVNALVKRASIQLQNDNLDACIQDFNVAEAIDSVNPDIFHQRGQVYILLEKFEEALVQFTRAFDLEPNSITFVHRLYIEYRIAAIAQNHVRLHTLIEEFEAATVKYADCVEGFNLMAQILAEQGRFEQADEFFAKAIAIDPENVTMYVHRGVLHLQWHGNVDSAIELINQAIAIDDKCEFALETLGTIEVQRNNMEQAIALFDKAITVSRSESQLMHLFSLKHAAIAQINVTRNLGIDMSAVIGQNMA